MQGSSHLTLTQAAKITPGRPSTNCLWRWCRRGVLARSGQRIHLGHIRVGGKIFTTALWIEEFGCKLAAADALYFDRDGDAASEPTPVPPPRPIEPRWRATLAPSVNADIERELDEAGL